MHLRSIQFHPERYPTAESYPFNLAAFRQTDCIRFETPVTIFVGENGTGKSTLLEAIARKCGIHIWREDGSARFVANPYEDRLCDFVSAHWTDGRVPGSFFGSDMFRDFSRILEEWAVADPGQLKHFGGKSLITQSHGESLMSFFTARYRIKGLYLMDEPETALSPKSQIRLLRLLESVSDAGHAQFIIASHSPILLACPGASIYSFDSVPILPIRYEDTEHYQVYRDFMKDRMRFLNG